MNNNIKNSLAALCVVTLAACGPSSTDSQDGAKKSTPSSVPERVSLNPQGILFAKRVFTNEILDAVLGHDTAITIEQAIASAGVDMMVSADVYAADYEANEIAADNKYKGKTILITGKVDSINKGITGKGYLALRAKGAPLGMQAHLSSDGTEGAASLSKSSLVYLVCETGPKIGPISTTRNCRLFSQHMSANAASIEKKIDRFFAGNASLPKAEALPLIVGYVWGNRLPSDSPCMADFEKCEGEIKKLNISDEELRAEVQKIGQELKME